MSRLNDCCSCFQKFIRKFDLFPANQFLRYKGDPEYSTATGGVTSLLVIGIFVALFASMGLQTARRNIISSSQSRTIEGNPSFSDFETSIDGKFMFGVAVDNLNLSSVAPRYWNITAYYVFLESNVIVNATWIQLQTCTRDHWNFSPDTVQVYDSFEGDTWLCPPLGFQFKLGGKPVSPVSSAIVVQFMPCDQSVDPSCISTADMTALQASLSGQFRLSVPVASAVINAGEKEYVSMSVEDRNYYTFSSTMGIEARGYIERAKVETDVSLLPTQDIEEEEFPVVPDYFQTNQISTMAGILAQISIQKSPTARTYKRSFNKIDNYFSYVGGLIGTILGLIFVMGFYSERAYGISIASQLFVTNDGETISSNGFHIGYLFTIFIGWVTQSLGCCQPKMQMTALYTQCLDEIEGQLDIAVLMRKMIYFERAINTLFTPHQLRALQIQKKDTLEQAEQKRKKFEVSIKAKQKGRGEVTFGQGQGRQNGTGSVVNDHTKQCIVFPVDNQVSSDEISSQQFSISSVSSASTETKQKVKEDIQMVIIEAQRGDQVSGRIAQELNPDVLERIGFEQTELKRVRRKSRTSRKPSLKEEDKGPEASNHDLSNRLDLEELKDESKVD